MKNSQELLKKITDLTIIIEKKYPELYQFLDENPITIAQSKNPDVNGEALKNYLDTLEELIENHVNTRQKV